MSRSATTARPPAKRLEPAAAAEYEERLRGYLGLLPTGVRLPARTRFWGWVATAIATVVAAVVRLVNLSHPHAIIFDETYYVKGAYSLLHMGYEGKWEGDTANELFLKGDYSALTTFPDYVVHPPLGKWLMAAGQGIFGSDTGTGWRIAVAILGIASVALTARIAMHMFRSPWLAGFAGLAMALDGMGIVLSRTGILDNILAFFVLFGFWALLKDRESSRATLAHRVAHGTLRRASGDHEDAAAPKDSLGRTDTLGRIGSPETGQPASSEGSQEPGQTASSEGPQEPGDTWPLADSPATDDVWAPEDPWGPRILWRPWMFVAGLALGAACGVKWSGIYAVAVVGLVAFAWNASARRTVGVPLWFGAGVFRDGFPAFVALVPTSLLTYLAAWIPWFVNPHGYFRDWAASVDPSQWPLRWAGQAINSFLHYHSEMWAFHHGLSTPHTYQSQMWQWIVQGRPVSFYWLGTDQAPTTCSSHECVQAITSIGNIAVWWLALVSLVFVVWAAVRRRDWRAIFILSGYVAMWLPWISYTNRTIFQFYAVAFLPFVVLALTYGVAVAARMLPGLNSAAGTTQRRTTTAQAPVDRMRAFFADHFRDSVARPASPDAARAASDTEFTPATSDTYAAQTATDTDAALPATSDDTTEERPSTNPGDEPEAPAEWWIAPPASLLVPGIVMAAIVAVAAFWYPLWTGITVNYSFWNLHMWFSSWI